MHLVASYSLYRLSLQHSNTPTLRRLLQRTVCRYLLRATVGSHGPQQQKTLTQRRRRRRRLRRPVEQFSCAWQSRGVVHFAIGFEHHRAAVVCRRNITHLCKYEAYQVYIKVHLMKVINMLLVSTTMGELCCSNSNIIPRISPRWSSRGQACPHQLSRLVCGPQRALEPPAVAGEDVVLPISHCHETFELDHLCRGDSACRVCRLGASTLRRRQAARERSGSRALVPYNGRNSIPLIGCAGGI